MSGDLTRILTITRELNAMAHDDLLKLDHEMLQSVRPVLLAHKKKVDRVLLRPSLVNERHVN